MSIIGPLITGIASIVAGNRASRGAKEAAGIQSDAAMEGVKVQRQQFNRIQKLLSPYVGAGAKGLRRQLNLAGLNGESKQRGAIRQIKQGAEYENMLQQANENILQTASATGGLRGGNTQKALAEVAPNILSGLIDKQYARLGGIAQMGQNSAVGVGNAGQVMGGQVSDLIGQSGAANAGAALASASAFNQGLGGVAQAAGQFFGQQDATKELAKFSAGGGF